MDLPIIFLQIGLPIGLILGLMFSPATNAIGYTAQLFATVLALLAVSLASIWTLAPWWMPSVYAVVAILAVAYRLLTGHSQIRKRAPDSLLQWGSLFMFIVMAVGGGIVAAGALQGRKPPQTGFVNLPMPLGSGTYLVANGGSTMSVNAHYLTLEPATDRQRAYRGQSFAVDLVKIDQLGLRARGWHPQDPSEYLIFAEPVFAPCDGIVDIAVDDRPDMQVPLPDATRLEGNHVFLDCGDYGVLLAHLQSGSVAVAVGDKVKAGQMVGRVGNSGRSFEPHLHMHAQRHAPDGPVFSGEPLHLLLDGIFPVRNRRLKGREWGE